MNQRGVAEAARLATEVGGPYGLQPGPTLAGRRDPFRFQLVEAAVEGRIGTITINRPDKLNALNEDVVAQLEERFDALAASPAVDAIVIAGKGKAFVAGADIGWFVARLDARRIDDVVAFTRRGHELLRKFARTPKVVIAKVDGLSLGGGSELALACDWVVGTRRASFGFPECGIGIYPGLGGTQRLPRRIGVALAKAFIFTGYSIGADAARALGVVDRLAAHGEVRAAIEELVRAGKRPDRQAAGPPPREFEELAKVFPAGRGVDEVLAGPAPGPEAAKVLDRVRSKAPIALRLADELIEGSARWPIDEGIAQELARLPRVFATEDAYLGLSTVGRGRPVFKGR
jgi:enoyl-CoA hydratase/3-hydroxyacyl-CoA dehydrogenase